MKIRTLAIAALLTSSYSFSQNVGINTDGSAPGMMLHVKVAAGNNGIRIQNAAGNADGIINFQDGVTNVWTLGFDANDNNDFKISNSATLGTNDRLILDENSDQILSGYNGTQASPAWSFSNDPNTGMFRSVADELAFTAGNVEFLVFDEGGTDVGVFNENAADIDYRFEGTGDANLLFVDFGNDAIGLNTTPDANNPLASALQAHSIRSFLSVGNDGNSGDQMSIGIYLGPDPVIIPEQFGIGAGDGFGVVGWSGGYDLFDVASNNFTATSMRQAKRDISSINEHEAVLSKIYADLDNVKPSIYKYKSEYDDMIEGKETRYRPMAHLGLIVDEAPDYIKAATLRGVDVYGLSTLAILGAKQNKARLDKLTNTSKLHGTAKLINGKASIDISGINNANFTVMVTPSSTDMHLAVVSKSKNGFNVECDKSLNGSFDWMVMVQPTNTDDTMNSLTPEQLDMLTISPEEEQIIRENITIELLKASK